MKYTSDLLIELPVSRVIELFDSFENLQKWQPGLISFEHLSGVPGAPGAKTLLAYDTKGRREEMIETIITRDLPDEFTATYEAKGVMNWVSNRFVEEGGDRTRWLMENEFRFSGIMRVASVFMRGMIAKQTLADMTRFKEFAENA